MNIQVLEIKTMEPSLPNIEVRVSFTDDDRKHWIRSCDLTIFLDKEQIKNDTLTEIQDTALHEAHKLSDEVLSACVSRISK